MEMHEQRLVQAAWKQIDPDKQDILQELLEIKNDAEAVQDQLEQVQNVLFTVYARLHRLRVIFGAPAEVVTAPNYDH